MAPPTAPSRAMVRRLEERMDVVGDIVDSIVSLIVFVRLINIHVDLYRAWHQPLRAGFNLCSQVSVLMHLSFSISRSTGLPLSRCESMISSRSAARTPPYQTASRSEERRVGKECRS